MSPTSLRSRSGAMLLIALLAASLISCGSTTKYQPMHSRSIWGAIGGVEGYEDVQMDANTFRVNFEGNDVTRKEVIERYALYRCAELTVEKGFDYFIVVDESGDTDVNTAVSTDYSKKSSSTTVTQTSTYASQKTIKLYKGTKPENNATAYNAKELMTYLESHIERPKSKK